MSVRSPYDDISKCACDLCRHQTEILLAGARGHVLSGLREYRRLGYDLDQVRCFVDVLIAEAYP
jgi:hypothetical protein